LLIQKRERTESGKKKRKRARQCCHRKEGETIGRRCSSQGSENGKIEERSTPGTSKVRKRKGEGKGKAHMGFHLFDEDSKMGGGEEKGNNQIL